MTAADEKPFWETKTLEEMSFEEWESLCDGCARCCLQKLEDEDTGDIYYTQIVCKLMDQETCRCTEYERRSELVPTCITLTPEKTRELNWMPDTCAYRLLAEGKPLYDWHPLISGTTETVIFEGISVKDQVISEDEVPEEDWEAYITEKLV